MYERKLRVFHTADIHLDTPFSKLNPEQAAKRRNDLRSTFTSMMLYVASAKVDLCLLCGDLFDDGCATKATVDLMLSQFEKNASCQFVIAPGNHDPYLASSIYAVKKFPENVHIFKMASCERIEFPDLACDVYGWAFTAPSMSENPLRGFSPVENGRRRILCAHCDITSAISRYCPISEGDVVRAGFDYAGFGHIHKRGELKTVGKTTYGYSGAPEGRSYDECGALGAFVIDMQPDGTVSPAFREFSYRRYAIDTCDLTGVGDRGEAEERINAVLHRGHYDDRTLLRLELVGAVTPDFDAGSFPSVRAKLFDLDLRDKTTPTYSGELLERDITLRGALYRTLRDDLTSDDEATRSAAADALRYGLTALAGDDLGEL